LEADQNFLEKEKVVYFIFVCGSGISTWPYFTAAVQLSAVE